MENGNIRDYIQTNPNADRMRLLGEVASGAYNVYLDLSHWPLSITPGMEFLHENDIVHGDLCGVSPCRISSPLISRASYLWCASPSHHQFRTDYISIHVTGQFQKIYFFFKSRRGALEGKTIKVMVMIT